MCARKRVFANKLTPAKQNKRLYAKFEQNKYFKENMEKGTVIIGIDPDIQKAELEQSLTTRSFSPIK